MNKLVPLSVKFLFLSWLHELSPSEKAGLLSHESSGVDRIGIKPYLWWGEALHGVKRAGRATVFPLQAIGRAAAFDPELMFKIALAIDKEARAKYHTALQAQNVVQYFSVTMMAPMINILRDPRWGRSQESFGEDPFLTAGMACAFIQVLLKSL